MRKTLLGWGLLFALFTATGCGRQTVPVQFPDGFTVNAQIANTPQKREKGLMFVKQLPENSGMLFVFDQETEQFFWMKNTLIDLDIIFLSAEGKINQIFPRVEHTYTYTPQAEIPVVSAPAKYVLEVAAGTAERHHLQNGEVLHFIL